VVYQFWGFVGLSAGIILGIVGIVPLGLTAAAINHIWPAVEQIAIGIALYFLLYIFGIYLRSTMKSAGWNTPTATKAKAEGPTS
jgi:uncharacterized membrane protein